MERTSLKEKLHNFLVFTGIIIPPKEDAISEEAVKTKADLVIEEIAEVKQRISNMEILLSEHLSRSNIPTGTSQYQTDINSNKKVVSQIEEVLLSAHPRQDDTSSDRPY